MMTKSIGFLKLKHEGIFCLSTFHGQHHWLLPKEELIGWPEPIPLESPVVFELKQEPTWRRGRPFNVRMLDPETVSNADLCLPDYARVRRTIDHKRRWMLIEELLLQEAHDATLEAVIHEVPPTEHAKFWAKLPVSISNLTPAIRFAPDYIKKAWFNRLFPDFPNPVPPHLDFVTSGAEYICKGLTQRDKNLAKLWVKDETNSATFEVNYARMLSARAAEKATALFFRKLGFEVQDVAIQQLGSQDDWKTHDLLVERKVRVDVKNARIAANNSNSYVEHTVPRFKFDRNKVEVRIAGVVSPYLRLEEFENPYLIDNPPWRDSSKYTPKKQITILGVTKYTTIDELEKEYQTPVLELSLRQVGGRGVGARVNTLPPWIFDYPDKYYEELEVQLNLVRSLPSNNIPPAKIFSLVDREVPIKAFIAANRCPPSDWLDKFLPWQREFIRQLLEAGKPTLPVIFLSILRHFTSTVMVPPDGYEPAQYRSLLDWGGYPLGRRDPLNIVDSLCKNLQKIWQNRESIKLSEFERFFFQGLGILQGRRVNTTYKTTLIAYCGGFTERLVKCGYPDLILGVPGIEECEQCHHLICPHCKHCYKNCEANGPRQRALFASRENDYKHPNLDPSLFQIDEDMDIPL